MDPHALSDVVETVWLWLALPLTALAALVLTVRLRAPQILKLPAAFRALQEEDPGADGTLHPATAVVLSTAASYGAAGAVGAATAVALGGAGALAWLWLFTFLLAPLRMSEALLARTSPPGAASGARGSLAGRLLAEEKPGLRGVGWLLLLLLPVAGFTFYGGVHGTAVADAAEQLLPGSALPLGLAVAVLGATCALAPTRKTGSILGWTAAVSLIALFGAALFAFFHDAGRGLGGFGRAVMDALYDAPRSGAFSGALAGEIAVAAILHILPPVAAPSGVVGALSAEAQAETTKKQAAAALLGPLFYGLLSTMVGLSIIATNAFTLPVERTRPITELSFYRVGFETTSQRREDTRLFTGLIRIEDGSSGVVEVNLGGERGMVSDPTYEVDGEPADVALLVRDGAIEGLQKPDELGALRNRPLAEVEELIVRGEMLPRGGRLLAESMSRGGGALIARVALAALLLLAALGAAAWGLGIAATLRSRLGAHARWAGILPGAGMALAVTGAVPELGFVGALVAGVSTALVSTVLLAKAGEVARLAKDSPVTSTDARSGKPRREAVRTSPSRSER